MEHCIVVCSNWLFLLGKEFHCLLCVASNLIIGVLLAQGDLFVKTEKSLKLLKERSLFVKMLASYM